MSRTMRPKRAFLAPLVSLLVGLGLAVVPTGTAHAAEPTAVTIKFTRAGKTLTGQNLYGVFYDGIGPAIPTDTFRVEGRLSSAGTPLAGKEVWLYRMNKTSQGDLEPVASDVTDADGSYAFGEQVKAGAYYGVQFEGDETYALGNSGQARFVPAMRDFNANARKVNGKLYFRGTVRPSWNDRLVTLQKKACGTCAWKTVTSKRTGAAGGYSFRVYYPSKVGPVWRWQVVLRRAGDFERSFSAILTTRRVYGRMAAASLG